MPKDFRVIDGSFRLKMEFQMLMRLRTDGIDVQYVGDAAWRGSGWRALRQNSTTNKITAKSY
jgi:hypothetical protein